MIYIPVESEFAGALGFASTLSQDYLLDNWIDEVAKAVDGDPATTVRQPT